MIDYQRLFEVKRATIRNFAGLWTANFEANRSAIARSPGVAAMFEKFPGVPSLVVGAGPSLDKNIQWLSMARGRALVICVDAIFAGLAEEGAEPSIVVTLDPQPDVARFFAGAPSKGKILAAPTIIHPDTLAAWEGEVVFYNKFAPDIPALVRIAAENPALGYLIPGGSVLTVGLDLAFRMGANPIGFLGQDLSILPGGPAYSSRVAGGRGDAGGFLHGDDVVTDVDIFGREALTRKSLFITKQWMEWAFTTWKRKNGPADFYNLTEGGIVSNHCRVAALSEWIMTAPKGKRNIGWALKKALRRKR